MHDIDLSSLKNGGTKCELFNYIEFALGFIPLRYKYFWPITRKIKAYLVQCDTFGRICGV